MGVSSNSESPSLPVHEWIAVLLIVVMLSVLVSVVTYSSVSHIDDEIGLPHHIMPEIQVTVEGAVEKPGSYQVKRGTTLQEVLDLAKPLHDADLSRLKPEKKVRSGQVIKISPQKPKKEKKKKEKKSK